MNYKLGIVGDLLDAIMQLFVSDDTVNYKLGPVGPGNVWVIRSFGDGFRVVVLLVETLTNHASDGDSCWVGMTLFDEYNPEYELRQVVYTRSHLFEVFERLT